MSIQRNVKEKNLESNDKSNNEVTNKEIMSIFNSVDWNKNPKDIIDAFKNSYYVTAYHKNKLIAFARAVSDGYYYTSIFDVIVYPRYQKRGIAKELMKILIRKFKGSYFFLSYTDGNREFYKKCGFEDLPTGMWIDKGRSYNLDIDSL